MGEKRKLTDEEVDNLKYQVRLNLKIAHYLFIALGASQFLIVFFGWLMAGESTVYFSKQAQESPLFILLPIISIGTAILVWFIQYYRLKKFDMKRPLLQKVFHFRDTALMQAVFIEGANVFAVMVAIITKTYLPYMFFFLGILVFAWAYPSERRFVKEYGVGS
jgi:hypothetical protein